MANVEKIFLVTMSHDHKWELLVPDKNWEDIKNIIIFTMKRGVEEPYDSAFKRVMTYNGHEVEVSFMYCDGIIKISDAWVKG